MKKRIAYPFSLLGRFFSLIIPIVLLKLCRTIWNGVFSGYVMGKLKHCGNNFNIDSPCFYHGLRYISIGDNFTAFSGLRIEAYDKHINNKYTPEIVIGDNVSLNHDCHIACVNKIVISNNVLIASKVFITDHSHGGTGLNDLKLPPSQRKVVSKGAVIIYDNVWIGEGVAILPGVTIGANCIIGANAVVTKSFPANTVIGGNPAKVIKIIE